MGDIDDRLLMGRHLTRNYEEKRCGRKAMMVVAEKVLHEVGGRGE